MAVDAVKRTKFNPGTQNGIPVKVQVTIPIVFKLQRPVIKYDKKNVVKSKEEVSQ